MTGGRICGKIGKEGRCSYDCGELELFMGREAALPLYAALRDTLLKLYPDTELRPARTQITFR